MRHEYDAQVSRWVDGDTVLLDVDLGFNLWLHGQSFRLIGINAREKSQEGGPEALANVRALLPAGSPIVLRSIKPDKFGGRYDAQLVLPDGSDLSAQLIRAGWAAPWNGTGPKPVPVWPRLVGEPPSLA